MVPRHALTKGVQSRKEPFGGLDPNGSRQGLKVVLLGLRSTGLDWGPKSN
jgi:hypothetical protein